jgi:hypothetical protein
VAVTFGVRNFFVRFGFCFAFTFHGGEPKKKIFFLKLLEEGVETRDGVKPVHCIAEKKNPREMQQSDPCGASDIDTVMTAVATTTTTPPATNAGSNQTEIKRSGTDASTNGPETKASGGGGSSGTGEARIESKSILGSSNIEPGSGANNRSADLRSISHARVPSPSVVFVVGSQSERKTTGKKSNRNPNSIVPLTKAGVASAKRTARLVPMTTTRNTHAAREQKARLRGDKDIADGAVADTSNGGDTDADDDDDDNGVDDASVAGKSEMADSKEDGAIAMSTNASGGGGDGDVDGDDQDEEEEEEEGTEDGDSSDGSSVSSGSISPGSAMSFLFNRRKPAEAPRTVVVLLDVNSADLRRRGEAICTMLKRRSLHQHVMVTEKSLGQYLAHVVRTGQDPGTEMSTVPEEFAMLGALPLEDLDANITRATDLVLRHTKRTAPQTRKDAVLKTTFAAVSGRDRVAYCLCSGLPTFSTVLAILVWMWTAALLGISICNWFQDRPSAIGDDVGVGLDGRFVRTGSDFDGGRVVAMSDFLRENSRLGTFLQSLTARWHDHWTWRAPTLIDDFLNEFFSLSLSVLYGAVALASAWHYSLSTLLCVVIQLARYAGVRTLLCHLAFFWVVQQRHAMQHWMTKFMSVRNNDTSARELALTLVRTIANPLEITPAHWIRHQLQRSANNSSIYGCVALVTRLEAVSTAGPLASLFVIRITNETPQTTSTGPHLIRASARLDIHVSTPLATSKTPSKRNKPTKSATAPNDATVSAPSDATVVAPSDATVVPTRPKRVYKSATATTTRAQKPTELEAARKEADKDIDLSELLGALATNENEDDEDEDVEEDVAKEDDGGGNDSDISSTDDDEDLSSTGSDDAKDKRVGGTDKKIKAAVKALQPTFVTSMGMTTRRFADRLGEVMLSETVTDAFGEALDEAREKYRNVTDTPQTKRKRQEAKTKTAAAVERNALLGVTSQHQRRRLTPPCTCGACGGASATADLVLCAGASYDEFVRVAATHLQEIFCLDPIRSTEP